VLLLAALRGRRTLLGDLFEFEFALVGGVAALRAVTMLFGGAPYTFQTRIPQSLS
jgi:hypothetical protein